MPRRHAVGVLLLALVAYACGGNTVRADGWFGDEVVTTFFDDFDGAELNAQRWNTCHWWSVDGGCTITSNNELQWYQPDNVSVVDGVLRLEARVEQVVTTAGEVYSFTSGMVTTGPPDNTSPAKYDFRYGGAEARIKVPLGAEFWPAFWLLPASTESRPEIDIMEMHGDEPTVNGIHLHGFDATGERQSFNESFEGSDFSQDWHTFGVTWSPEQITWLLDGEPIRAVKRGNEAGVLLPEEPLYLVVNLAIDPEPRSAPAGPAAFPAALEIDWVRVWQRAAA